MSVVVAVHLLFGPNPRTCPTPQSRSCERKDPEAGLTTKIIPNTCEGRKRALLW